MSKWRDATSYSQGDKEKIPTTWKYKAGDLNIVVHKYVGCGETWHLTCPPFYNCQAMPSLDIEKMKKLALQLVLKEILEIKKDLEEEQ